MTKCDYCGEDVEEVFPTADKEHPNQCLECLKSFAPHEQRMCCDDPERMCGEDCTAFMVRAIPRLALRKDQMGMWNHAPIRDPVYVKFCQKHRFPILLAHDRETIEEESK